MTRAAGHDALRALLRATARRYRAAGHHAYFHARSKLQLDPVYAAILRDGLIPDGARVLDLGCGQGLLLSLLVEAETRSLPDAWPPAPGNLQLSGVEREAKLTRWAGAALAGRASLVTADLRDADLPPSDVVILLDVLHYLPAAEQRALLERIVRSLSPQGRLLLRVLDAAGGTFFTLAWDRVGALLRGQSRPRYHVRAISQWQQLLGELGLQCHATPMSEGTPFRNVLLVASRKITPA
jgi:SAM-dependent methyltransferase